eukprot:COSAG01_NODE_4759_length_4760_cov_2.330401_2_plen_142_part_00
MVGGCGTCGGAGRSRTSWLLSPISSSERATAAFGLAAGAAEEEEEDEEEGFAVAAPVPTAPDLAAAPVPPLKPNRVTGAWFSLSAIWSGGQQLGRVSQRSDPDAARDRIDPDQVAADSQSGQLIRSEYEPEVSSRIGPKVR